MKEERRSIGEFGKEDLARKLKNMKAEPDYRAQLTHH